MRTEIFYWKCDSPVPPEQKKKHFSDDKYTKTACDAVHGAVHDFLGREPDSLKILPSDGNHQVAVFLSGGGKYLFRADEGRANDDVYLLAESTVMNLLHSKNLPVPQVYHTDISLEHYPFRYQIMEFADFPCLNKFAKEGTLKEQLIAEQSGAFLAKLHQIHFPGFGFFNTEKLAAGKELEGLDHSAADYFKKCLEKHLSYLTQHQLISAEKEERIRIVFDKVLPLLQGIQGTLLHRDYAYWNILGTPEKIERVIDWDDSISGDPADDFGIIGCFLRKELIEIILKRYSAEIPVNDSFRLRIHLHTLRNMLWKAMIRDYMGYFTRGKDFFLNSGNGMSLRELTLYKIDTELKELEKFS